jgi:hypothetical protein
MAFAAIASKGPYHPHLRVFFPSAGFPHILLVVGFPLLALQSLR